MLLLLLVFSINPYLPDSCAASEEYRTSHRQQFLHQVAVADCVCGGDQHLKKRLLAVVFKWRDYLLPWLQTLVVKVHVHTPQGTILRELHGTYECTLNDTHENTYLKQGKYSVMNKKNPYTNACITLCIISYKTSFEVRHKDVCVCVCVCVVCVCCVCVCVFVQFVLHKLHSWELAARASSHGKHKNVHKNNSDINIHPPPQKHHHHLLMHRQMNRCGSMWDVADDTL